MLLKTEWLCEKSLVPRRQSDSHSARKPVSLSVVQSGRHQAI